MTSKNSEFRSEPEVTAVDNGVQITALKDLLLRITNQDVKALNELYEKYSGLLMSVISGILNNKAESEDILQESFLTIWNKAGMYQPHLGKPTSWMVTIAKNKAYDRYRKLVRQSDGIAILKDNMLTNSKVSSLPPIADNEELLEGFKELNPDQRKAIELVFYQGYTQQEAAIKLDAPLGTVKARIRRGLLQLKQFLTSDSQSKLS